MSSALLVEVIVGNSKTLRIAMMCEFSGLSSSGLSTFVLSRIAANGPARIVGMTDINMEPHPRARRIFDISVQVHVFGGVLGVIRNCRSTQKREIISKGMTFKNICNPFFFHLTS